MSYVLYFNLCLSNFIKNPIFFHLPVLMCVLKNLTRKVLGNSMKFKIEIEAFKEKIKKDYVIEALDTKELLTELSRIEREWINETGILNFTTTVVRTE
jgi:hypothetical protein